MKRGAEGKGGRGGKGVGMGNSGERAWRKSNTLSIQVLF